MMFDVSGVLCRLLEVILIVPMGCSVAGLLTYAFMPHFLKSFVGSVTRTSTCRRTCGLR